MQDEIEQWSRLLETHGETKELLLQNGVALAWKPFNWQQNAGLMEDRDGEHIYTHDFLFWSPSTAAAVVFGRSANGWAECKADHGQTLSDVYRAPAESNEPEADVLFGPEFRGFSPRKEFAKSAMNRLDAVSLQT